MGVHLRARVLVIDDDPAFSEVVSRVLKRDHIQSILTASPSDGLQAYTNEKMNFDLVMIDYCFKGSDVTGADLATKIKTHNPHQAILFMTGYEENQILKSMLRTGAARSFVEKGGNPESILAPVRQTLNELGIRDVPPEQLEDELEREADIRAFGMIGRSKALHAIIKQVEVYRRFRSRFLIVGDTGAGKELIAKAFRIPGKPFYAIDCARFTSGQEQFLESELYGHVKGAYTGADRDKRGAFEIANGGIVFLDELHCLSVIAQAKLLRTLQEMNFRRLGDTRATEISFDVTLVAAAKPVIFQMTERGEFKEDLYFRLAKSVLQIPPLQSRPEDIRPLAKYFTEKYARKHGLVREPHPQLLRELEAYSWPGNVRELEGVIDHLVMTSMIEIIGPELFRLYLEKRLLPANSAIAAPKANLKLVVESVQTEQIISALGQARTVGEAADSLGVPRTTLNHRMKKLNIDSQQYLGTEIKNGAQ